MDMMDNTEAANASAAAAASSNAAMEAEIAAASFAGVDDVAPQQDIAAPVARHGSASRRHHKSEEAGSASAAGNGEAAAALEPRTTFGRYKGYRSQPGGPNSPAERGQHGSGASQHKSLVFRDGGDNVRASVIAAVQKAAAAQKRYEKLESATRKLHGEYKKARGAYKGERQRREALERLLHKCFSPIQQSE